MKRLLLLLAATAAIAGAQPAMIQTTLSADITADQVEVYVSSATGLSAGMLGYADRELYKIVSITGTTLRVTRGVAGKQTAHTSGVTAYFGPAFGFTSRDPAGRCTALTTPSNPYINYETGGRWVCTSNTWVNSNSGSTVGVMSDLTDTAVAGPSDKDGMFWDLATQKWTKRTIAAGPSGGLDFTIPWQPDIDTAIVPRKGVANVWAALNAYTPSPTQNITAVGNQIAANANIVQIDPDATYTLTSAPTIDDGVNGQVLTICNLDSAFSVILQDQSILGSSNVRNSGRNVVILPGLCRSANFSTALGDWVFTPEAFDPLDSTAYLASLPFQSSFPSVAISPVASRIYFYRVVIAQPTTFTKLTIYHATNSATGGAKMSYGIYDKNKALIVQTGALAADSGAALFRTTTVASTTLLPGVYYWVWAASATDAAHGGMGTGTPHGALNQGAAPGFGSANSDTYSTITGLPSTLTTLTAGAVNIPFVVALN